MGCAFDDCKQAKARRASGPFPFQVRASNDLLTAARSAATTTGTTATATGFIVGRLRSARARRLSGWSRSAFDAVEVRLVLLVDLLAAFLVEVVSAFDQNGALVRFRLTLVEFMAGLDGRGSRGSRLGGGKLTFFGFGRG